MGSRYREMEIRTASPEMLVVKMYEGAIRQVRLAIDHHRAGRVGERGAALSRALAILAELRQALDFERGGEIARNLDQLYRFLSERLLEANLRGDEEPLVWSVGILDSLHGAWAEIARRPPESRAAARG